MKMTEQEFLSAYKDLPLTFLEVYKYRVTMVNKEQGITVSGTLEYRGNVAATETVSSFFQEVDYFNFEIQPTNPLTTSPPNA